jgi:hypothetical protein
MALNAQAATGGMKGCYEELRTLPSEMESLATPRIVDAFARTAHIKGEPVYLTLKSKCGRRTP